MPQRPFLLLVVLIGISLVHVSLAASAKTVRIGTIHDGPNSIEKHLFWEVQKELEQLLKGEFDVQFPTEGQREGDWTTESIESEMEALLNDANVDLIITFGLIASDVACKWGPLSKPVIAPMALGSQLQNLPYRNGASGKQNLNYLSLLWGIDQDLDVFYKIAPFKKLAFIVNDHWMNHFFKKESSQFPKQFQNALDTFSADKVIIPVGTVAAQAFENMPDDVDAVYLLPLPQMSQSEHQLLINELNRRKLPTFSSVGKAMVKMGVLSAYRPDDTLQLLARQVAVNVFRILLEEEPGTLPVAFTTGTRLSVNMETARQIGVSPPFSVLLDADMIGQDDVGIGRKLTIKQCIDDALAANLDLAIAHQEVLVKEAEMKKARANFFPALDASTATTLIDKDRAQASNGSQPQFTWTGSLILTETLAEGAFANYTIQKHLKDAEKFNQESVRLDIVQAASVAYLEVIKAENALRIQKSNVQVSRENLELARKRVELGASRLSEVFRWESEIATQRQQVVASHVQVLQAKMELNRLLKRPIMDEFEVEAITVEEMLSSQIMVQFSKRLDDPLSMLSFHDFVVQDAYKKSFDLKALDENRKVLDRSIDSTRRSFWVPSFTAQGNMDYRFAEAGEGVEGPIADAQDRLNWSVAGVLTWNLVQGGAQMSELGKLRAQLLQTNYQDEQLRQYIEQNVRTALIMTRASKMNIRFSREAAEASQKNLELVTDEYSRGAVTVIELLDAQNAAVSSELSKSNAELTFLEDFVRAQRAAGTYFFLSSEETLKQWLKDLDRYQQQQSGSSSKEVSK